MPCAGGACTATEYGDDRDMMGGTATGEFHAYQKERLGWLNYGSSPTIQTVGGSGTYWIANLEGGGSPSALKVLKSKTSSDQTYYYIEARAQVSYDAPYAPGVMLHTGNSANGNSAYEVDLDPDSSGFDSLLDAGQTFTDAAAGFTVTTVSADAAGAWVVHHLCRRAVHDVRADGHAVAGLDAHAAIGDGELHDDREEQ